MDSRSIHTVDQMPSLQPKMKRFVFFIASFAMIIMNIGFQYAYCDSSIKKNIPIFCVAYITPDAKGQENQEIIVAKYPIIIVPQDNSPQFVQWRDKIKKINPKVIMLAYQMVIEETTVPGPGHSIIREIDNSWCVYDNGLIPKVGPMNKLRKIYDPRNVVWQEKFIKACSAVLDSYPYDGIFLDQCTIFNKASYSEKTKNEMREALQLTLIKLRNKHKNSIFIGNSREKWVGLNGEMNEKRFNEIKQIDNTGHVEPFMNLFLSYISDINEVDKVKSEMARVHEIGGIYGVSIDLQHVLWFDFFDEILVNFSSQN